MEGLIIFLLIIALPIAAAPFIALYFIGKALINYAAKKNAEAFHYDELATKITAEIMRAHKLIEMQQPTGQQQPQRYAQTAQPINQPANQQGDTVPEPRRYRPPGL